MTGPRDGWPHRLSRRELITRVERIIRAEVPEEELDALLDRLDLAVPVPTGYFSGLIYWPDRHGLGRTPTATEIVDASLAYRSIAL